MNESPIRSMDRAMLTLWENGLAITEISRAFPLFPYRVDRYRLRGVVDGRAIDWARFEDVDLEAEKTSEAENRWLEDWAILALWEAGRFTAEEMNRAIPEFRYPLHLYRLRGVVDGQTIYWAKFWETRLVVSNAQPGTEGWQVAVEAEKQRLRDRVMLKQWESGFSAEQMDQAFPHFRHALHLYQLRGVVDGRTIDWARFEEIDLEAKKAESAKSEAEKQQAMKAVEAEKQRLRDRAMLKQWESGFSTGQMNQAFPHFRHALHLYRLRGVVDGQTIDWARFEEIDLEAEKEEAKKQEAEMQQTAKAVDLENRWLEDWAILTQWEDRFTAEEMSQAFPHFRSRLRLYRLCGVVDGRTINWAKFEGIESVEEETAEKQHMRKSEDAERCQRKRTEAWVTEEEKQARVIEEEQRARVKEAERLARQDYRRAVKEGRDQKQAIEDYQRAMKAAMERNPQAKTMLRLGPPPT